mmetsp:Transcript_65137/g.128625  ORF Transcript_65137/g.128625 Transcript_65137/m.128625 type:complete len:123 (+) Transcript_65137:34-402(+)
MQRFLLQQRVGTTLCSLVRIPWMGGGRGNQGFRMLPGWPLSWDAGHLAHSVPATMVVARQAMTVVMQAAATEFGSWMDYLRPRKFSVRLDVRMKKASAPYPRNPNRKRPPPKVKGIIHRLID